MLKIILMVYFCDGWGYCCINTEMIVRYFELNKTPYLNVIPAKAGISKLSFTKIEIHS